MPPPSLPPPLLPFPLPLPFPFLFLFPFPFALFVADSERAPSSRYDTAGRSTTTCGVVVAMMGLGTLVAARQIARRAMTNVPCASCVRATSHYAAATLASPPADVRTAVGGGAVRKDSTGIRWYAAGAGTDALERAQSLARRRAVDNAAYLTALVVGMVGFTYASVPLYRMFCQATGYGGTVQRVRTLEDKLKDDDASAAAATAAATSRELVIHFNADVTDGMHWKFTPTQRSVRTNPGESTLAFYTVKNLSDKAVTGVSTYNVSPQKAGIYFNKIQCFCFEEQRLRPGEEIDMPVFFYIDREFATDPAMEGIDRLTLSYTFFKVAEEDEEAHASEARKEAT